MAKNILLEVCTNSVDSAIAAQEGGAYRVELCNNIYEGGTTPSIATIELARHMLDIKLNVLIRPRGGDFCYNNAEFEIMRRDIIHVKNIGVDGIVIGMLTKDGQIDVDRLSKIVKIAGSLSITFHRAFDMVLEPFKALEQLISLDIDRILTSGQKNKAIDGVDLIAELVKKAENKIIIMPGSGINIANAKKLINKTKVSEIHASCRKRIDSVMTFRRDNIYMGGLPAIPEYGNYVTDLGIVKKLNELINGINKK